VKRTGVPTAMLWTCGGHGVCLTNPGDPTTVAQATLAWLARYVQRDQSVATVAKFAFIDQNGVRYTAADYPLPTGAPLVGDGHGTLNLVATGGSGPANTSTSRDPLASVAGIITPGRASNALDVDIAAGSRAAVVVGAPQLRITYRGTAPAGERPTAVFAQVVDDATGIVVGNQITPVALTLDGQTHTATVPLEIIAFAARPGSRLTLQLVPTTVAYAQPRLGGQIEFDAVHVELPVAAGLNPA
jgi:ABC-2 type transport system ATP-binding protein